jgi:low affinity Fe/Cu permease
MQGGALMERRKERGGTNLSAELAARVTKFAGSSWGFGAALAVVVIWAATGPLFHFSNTWQLVINTGTTIVTFLMVFLIQRAQNKGALAVQLKLNELIAAIDAASNRLISVEDLSERELEILHEHYRQLASMAKDDAGMADTHSAAEASARHERKRSARATPRSQSPAR